jgi:hypothetical protein
VSVLQDRLVRGLRAALTGDRPAWPEGCEILVRAFAELSAQRGQGGMGPSPIAYADIGAWASLHRVPLAPHHVRCLTAMDRAWLDHAYRDRSAPEGVKRTPPRSAQALTPALFDLGMS